MAPNGAAPIQGGNALRFILRDFEKIVCAVLFLGMTMLGFANVVVRYGTNYSFASSEEILTNGFLLLTIFGAAIAARRGEHLAVTLVHDLLPRRLAQLVFVLSILLSVGLLAASAWFSWATLSNLLNSGMRSYALGVPAWWYQAGLPFGFALVILRYLQHAAETWRNPRAETPVTPGV